MRHDEQISIIFGMAFANRKSYLFRARYSRMMEESHFRSRGADYAWLLLLSAIALLICSVCIIIFATTYTHEIDRNGTTR